MSTRLWKGLGLLLRVHQGNVVGWGQPSEAAVGTSVIRDSLLVSRRCLVEACLMSAECLLFVFETTRLLAIFVAT